ncbi:hypothetical protein NUW54_g12224 [Trametes sanguinea]|uniref:Uncharacterized protein n=1 Tax=Trametes sanguinea TaxID=158606 RepID=A0ACC1N1H3_9APHY|nr:hypothetical protein NUW54_g12224 [Trametes sanguinea]
MQSTLENLDQRAIEVCNEAAALACAQVLQQLTVLEGLVDTNSRSREEWLEAQNELDYRMVRVRGLCARRITDSRVRSTRTWS